AVLRTECLHRSQARGDRPVPEGRRVSEHEDPAALRRRPFHADARLRRGSRGGAAGGDHGGAESHRYREAEELHRGCHVVATGFIRERGTTRQIISLIGWRLWATGAACGACKTVYQVQWKRRSR